MTSSTVPGSDTSCVQLDSGFIITVLVEIQVAAASRLRVANGDEFRGDSRSALTEQVNLGDLQVLEQSADILCVLLEAA